MLYEYFIKYEYGCDAITLCVYWKFEHEMVRTKNDTIVTGVAVVAAAAAFVVIGVIFTTTKTYLKNQLHSLRQSKNLIKIFSMTHVLSNENDTHCYFGISGSTFCVRVYNKEACIEKCWSVKRIYKI